MSNYENQQINVRVIQYQGDYAYCKAKFNNNWLPLTLLRENLESCDIKIGDYFTWIKREDRLVRLEDITEHPRRLTSEQIKALRKLSRVYQ